MSIQINTILWGCQSKFGMYNGYITMTTGEKELTLTIQETEIVNSADMAHLAGFIKESGATPEELEDVFMMYFEYTEKRKEDPELAPLFIHSPENPSEQLLAYMSSKHFEYYERTISSLVETYRDWDTLVFRSGMFGGKSSVVFEIIDRVKERYGIESSLLIADTMGESYITGRACTNKRRVRDAIRYGKKDVKDIDLFVSNLADIVVLDEYSFLDTESTLAIYDSCKKLGKKIIFLGLDTDAFGEELNIFNDKQFKDICSRKETKTIYCYSYTDPNDDIPQGIGSIRYFNLPNTDIWALDLSVLPLIISKEYKEIIRYYPSRRKLAESFNNTTFSTLLRQKFSNNSLQARLFSHLCGTISPNERPC